MSGEGHRLLWPAPAVEWSAEWIGVDDAADRDTYLQLRTAFVLAAPPTRHATLHVAAESLYRVWVNGTLVGRGPVRGTRTLAFYDAYDVTGLLKAGENWIALLVRRPASGTFKYASPRAAALAQLDVGGNPVAATDQNWQARVADAWAKDAPSYTFQMGACEHLDTRLLDERWTVGGDAHAWGEALVVAPATGYHGKRLLPRDISALHERRIEARRVSGARSLLYDAGGEFTAGVELEVEAPPGVAVDVAMDDANPVRREVGRYRFIDRYIAAGGRQTLGPTVAERGGRFIEITFDPPDAPVTVHRVTAIDRRYPLPDRPRLRSGDAGLDAIYDACVETIHACATDAFVDCPWRESALWVNDLIVEVKSWLSIGGDPAPVARTLRLVVSQPTPEGLIPAVCPDGDDAARLVFPATVFYLPMIVEDYLEATGDAALVAELLPPLMRAFDAARLWEDAAGLAVAPPGLWNFVDWGFGLAGVDLPARSACVNWFYALGLDALARLTRSTGTPDAAEAFERRAARVADAIHEAFWSDARGCYVEGVEKDPAFASQLTQALALRSGRAPQRVRPLLVHSLTRDDLHAPELFMHRFVLEALLDAGRAAEAAAVVRRLWGPIVAAGSPTIWETGVYQPGTASFSGSGTLCHGFATSPTFVLPRLVERRVS